MNVGSARQHSRQCAYARLRGLSGLTPAVGENDMAAWRSATIAMELLPAPVLLTVR